MGPGAFESVRSYWRFATSCPDGFAVPGWVVALADGHQAAPNGWVGVVELRGSAVVAAPSAIASQMKELLHRASSVGDLTRSRAAGQIYGPFRQTLGPAMLLYGRPHRSASAAADVVGPLAGDDPRVLAVISAASAHEVEESGLTHATSGVFVAIDHAGVPASACGWRPWPYDIAHVSVLTSTSHRSRGFGRVAASAALQAAVAAGLVAQWRAVESNTASIALGASLGLEPIGRQFSTLIDTNAWPPACLGPR